MAPYLRVLMVDASSEFYRVVRYRVGDFFGPVDLGLHLSRKHDSLNFGVGLLAGSLFNGSNRLIVSGNSPCWGGFYISAMGGAGLVFDNLGINMVYQGFMRADNLDVASNVFLSTLDEFREGFHIVDSK